MNTITLEQCSRIDYNLTFLGSVEMPQRVEYPAFSSVGYPKKQDMVLLVNDCQTRYEVKDKILQTKSGDVVYVPKGSQYRVECVADGKKSCTMQINFLLFDENFLPFVLSEDILVFSPQTSVFRALFEKAMLLARNASVSSAEQKAVLFEILAELSKSAEQRSSYPIIEKGVEYLLAHYHENPSVSELSQACNLSNEYFRKLFKNQTGISPAEFKNNLRLKRAEQYLMYSDMPVVEISEALSYATVSHFIKSFKEQYGCSPLAFRNAFRKN